MDLHKLIDGRPMCHLLSISDSEYTEIFPAIELYREKTGLFIDQYSDLKLSSGVKPLIESLEAKDNGSSIYGLLIGALRKSEADGYGIIFVGD
ncbi:hypothetical protein [Marinobacter nauticus]|uniref:hypothetical protein n=1 Tax=Marinobacter nauticus TaxID=2743 RepID=UPI001C957644|nr:hypothetical protein [Marinobacter nauticus]MBY6220852.1 hypothetical protein [Marinobacter nauticus]